MNLIDSWSVLGKKDQIGQENCRLNIFNSYCFKQIVLVLFMVFSDEDLIFQESIVIQTTLLTLSVSLMQKIHDHTLGLMIQPFPPEFWNISGVTNCVAFPFGRGVCNAVVLYCINTPNAAVCFTLTAHHLNDSLGIGSKVIMTVIVSSPSCLAPTKIPLINNWHPSLMKWFGTWWSFSTCNRHSCWCSFNNHDIISSDCRLAKLWLIAFTLYMCDD